MSSDTTRKNMYYSFTIRAVLADVARRGFAEDQYLYLGIDAVYPQVMLPPNINYIEDTNERIGVVVISKETTTNLKIDEKQFSCILNDPETCPRPSKLTIPYDSIVSFVDPEADFALDRVDNMSIARMNHGNTEQFYEAYADWGQEDLFGQTAKNEVPEHPDMPNNTHVPEESPEVKVKKVLKSNIIDFRKG